MWWFKSKKQEKIEQLQQDCIDLNNDLKKYPPYSDLRYRRKAIYNKIDKKLEEIRELKKK